MKNSNAIFDQDPYLESFKHAIINRCERLLIARDEIAGYGKSLYSAVNNYLYYGLHREKGEWIFREWAPNATAIYLVGDFNKWERSEQYRLRSVGGGNWELRVSDREIHHEEKYKWIIQWEGGEGERIPSYANRCVQDPNTKLFSAQVWDPSPFKWKYKMKRAVKNPLIYEAHIGMSSEEQKVASFTEFKDSVLPRIVDLGYNTIQIMALQEHPYYGSFGYQVSNFYALSSRFGTPEEFKALVDEAHRHGIAVIMDLVHSHAVKNVLEGLSLFDGSDTLYFHSGAKGIHPAWNSRCFDYGKKETLFFLLSNCKFWMEEYHLDGFRFDGITSMLYWDHGLGRDFTTYDAYFNGGVDEDAVTYLGLANLLIREIDRNAITIAEDMSGMPGLAAPVEAYGIGFGYRMSMGIPDHWIKWIKELSDWDWKMGEIWYQLTNKRADERTISYAECHDQALVGDKTIIFRLIDKDMYFSMNKDSNNLRVDRGIALHKMIRLVTIGTAGDGYLNFMGNEFGHPEWIDFPREGNNWSFFYARRQWSLADSDLLRYKGLFQFDRAMIHLFAENDILKEITVCLRADEEKKVLIFTRGRYLFVFNFNPEFSFNDYEFEVTPGKWMTVLDSDAVQFGGFGRNDDSVPHFTEFKGDKNVLSLYLTSRSSCVLFKSE